MQEQRHKATIKTKQNANTALSAEFAKTSVELAAEKARVTELTPEASQTSAVNATYLNVLRNTH